MYSDELNETFSSMVDLIQEFCDDTYEDASTILFCHIPSMFLQLCYKLLILVPPLRDIFSIKYAILQTAIIMTINERNNDVKAQLMTIHLE